MLPDQLDSSACRSSLQHVSSDEFLIQRSVVPDQLIERSLFDYTALKYFWMISANMKYKLVVSDLFRTVRPRYLHED